MISRSLSLITITSVASILGTSVFASGNDPDRPQSSLEYREMKRDQFNDIMFAGSKDYFCGLEHEQRERLMTQAVAVAKRIDPRIKEIVDTYLQEAENSGDFEREEGQSALVAYACNSDQAKPMGRLPE